MRQARSQVQVTSILLNGHVYTSGGMGSVQSKLRSLRCTKRTPSLPQIQALTSLTPTQAPLSLVSTQAPPSLAPIQAPPNLALTQAPPSLALNQAPPSLAPTQAPPTQAPSLAPSSLAPSRRILNLQFRVLIIGRANAGKTSILQRVCDTTESPTIYRLGKYGQRVEEVRGPIFVCESQTNLTANQFKLEVSMDVSDTRTSLSLPVDIVPARRAHH